MKKILLVAGESSGDAHAALLACRLRERDPDVELYGCGGSALAGQGVRMVVDLVSLSVLGGAEVLKRYGHIRKIFHAMLDYLDSNKPDAVILVDYPGFNLRLAAEAKKRGIGVIYYVSPQIWAWAGWRIKRIARIVDLMMVILPFEKEIYEKAGVAVRYVGHPSLDRAVQVPDRESWLSQQGLNLQDRYVALLPGSRVMEIQKLLPVLLEAAARIEADLPQTVFLLPCAADHLQAQIQGIIASAPRKPMRLHILQGQAMEAARASELALVASGTATLETALMDTPMCIVYKVHPLSYAIGRMLVQIPYLGLVNVLAGKQIVPELLQHRARASLIAREALNILRDPARSTRMKQDLAALHKELGSPGASARAAEALLQWFGQRQIHAPVH